VTNQPVAGDAGGSRKRYLLVLLIPVFMFSAGVIGSIISPFRLQKFLCADGLQARCSSAHTIAASA